MVNANWSIGANLQVQTGPGIRCDQYNLYVADEQTSADPYSQTAQEDLYGNWL